MVVERWNPHARKTIDLFGIIDIVGVRSLVHGPAAGTCGVCGCTVDNCQACVAKTGLPCYWVNGDETLCSACAEPEQLLNCWAQNPDTAPWSDVNCNLLVADILHEAEVSDAVVAKLRAAAILDLNDLANWTSSPWVVPGEPVRMKRLADVPGLSEKQAKKAAAALVGAVSSAQKRRSLCPSRKAAAARASPASASSRPASVTTTTRPTAACGSSCRWRRATIQARR
jgi:hypothetical protein